MPVTVLKICKSVEDEIEVAGEFSTEEEAETFAEEAQIDDPDNDYEYIIELPPSRSTDH